MERRLSYEEVINWGKKNLFFTQAAEVYKDKAIKGFLDVLPNGELSLSKFINLWKDFVRKEYKAFIIDGSIVLPKEVFIASGHLKEFTDPIVKCTKCNSIFRADKLIEEKLNITLAESTSCEEFDKIIEENNLRCPSCNGKLGKVAKFNLMMKTFVSPKEIEAYLRPEACQSIFLCFKRIYERIKKLPIAIAQAGKAYRNEISPKNAFVRAREFRQMDVEIFFNPFKEDEVEGWEEIKDYKLILEKEGKRIVVSCEEAIKQNLLPSKMVASAIAKIQKFYLQFVSEKDFRLRILNDDEKAFYAKIGIDLEIFDGEKWVEFVACNHRSDYDLGNHERVSNSSLKVKEDNKEFIPNIMEISSGVERCWNVIIKYHLFEETLENGKKRTLLKIPAIIAPFTAIVLPLVSNKKEIVKKAKEVYEFLCNSFYDSKYINFKYDEKGSIGSRYRESDEIGIPLAITIDYQSLEDNTVTIRDRDTMKQIRVKIEELPRIIKEIVYEGKNYFE